MTCFIRRFTVEEAGLLEQEEHRASRAVPREEGSDAWRIPGAVLEQHCLFSRKGSR